MDTSPDDEGPNPPYPTAVIQTGSAVGAPLTSIAPTEHPVGAQPCLPRSDPDAITANLRGSEMEETLVAPLAFVDTPLYGPAAASVLPPTPAASVLPPTPAASLGAQPEGAPMPEHEAHQLAPEQKQSQGAVVRGYASQKVSSSGSTHGDGLASAAPVALLLLLAGGASGAALWWWRKIGSKGRGQDPKVGGLEHDVDAMDAEMAAMEREMVKMEAEARAADERAAAPAASTAAAAARALANATAGTSRTAECAAPASGPPGTTTAAVLPVFDNVIEDIPDDAIELDEAALAEVAAELAAMEAEVGMAAAGAA